MIPRLVAEWLWVSKVAYPVKLIKIVTAEREYGSGAISNRVAPRVRRRYPPSQLNKRQGVLLTVHLAIRILPDRRSSDPTAS